MWFEQYKLWIEINKEEIEGVQLEDSSLLEKPHKTQLSLNCGFRFN